MRISSDDLISSTRWGLRRKTLLLVSVVTLVVMVVACWLGQRAMQALRYEQALVFARDHAGLAQQRVSGALRLEIALARQFAQEQWLHDWLEREGDPKTQASFRQEAEKFRQAFTSRNYFVGTASRNFYYADARSPRPQKAYTIQPENPEHAWYLATLRHPDGLWVNVDFDRVLNVTNVWVNVAVHSRHQEPLAVVGTGIELSHFLSELLPLSEPGVVTMIVDTHGVVVAHPDTGLMQFDLAQARTHAPSAEKSLLDWVDGASVRLVREALLAAQSGHSVVPQLVKVKGRPALLGFASVPGMDWTLVAVVDPYAKPLFTSGQVVWLAMGVLFTLGLMYAAVLLGVDRLVLRPLARLTSAVRAVASSNAPAGDARAPGDEIVQLQRAFDDMAASLQAHARTLKQQVAERTHELQEANRKLTELSITDALTGLLNRRRFDEQLTLEWSRAMRNHQPLALFMIDIDWFKQYNDLYGHQRGDACLAKVAQTLRRTVRRAGDLVARYGGEEFVIVAPYTQPEQALALAGSLCRAVEGLALTHEGSPFGRVTVSIGVAVLTARMPSSAVTLLRHADMALYQAKAAGRNQVAFHEAEKVSAASDSLGALHEAGQ